MICVHYNFIGSVDFTTNNCKKQNNYVASNQNLIEHGF
jgi:hypothetical protein